LRDLLSHRDRFLVVDIENMNRSPVLRECFGDCLANSAAASGDDGGFAVQSECTCNVRMFQSDTPLFQGMKSSWRSNSALVYTSPLATRTTRSRIASPISSTVLPPLMIAPVSMSMMSCIRCARVEFVEILMTGAMGFPVGVPNPLVNKTAFAPAAT